MKRVAERAVHIVQRILHGITQEAHDLQFAIQVFGNFKIWKKKKKKSL